MFEHHKKEKPIPSLTSTTGGAGGFQNNREFTPPIGSELFETPGSYTWTAPDEAAASGIDIVVIGGGGGSALYPSNTTGGSGGGGAALSYKNNVSISAGAQLKIEVGAGGRGSWGGPSAIPSDYQPAVFVGNNAENGGYSSVRQPSQPTAAPNAIVYAQGGYGAPGPDGGNGGSTRTGDGGGNGGPGGSQAGQHSYWSFGGGAGGYSGNGGDGGRWEAGNPPNNYAHGASAAQPGSGGAGGAAGWASRTGVNVFGRGPTGAINNPGSGGSNTKYGGGGSTSGVGAAVPVLQGQPGAVRIIWGPNRQFPDTNTGLDGSPAPS